MVVKVLLAGDCHGCFGTLIKRIQAVNTKNGPFDVVFCVGAFFAPGGSDGDVPVELKPYVNAETQPPVPVYFIGGYGKGSKATLDALASAPPVGPSAPGIHYLGRAGVAQVAGLTVAFLDGTYHPQQFDTNPAEQGVTCRYYTRADVAAVRSRLGSLEGEVDLLLSAEWPAGLARGVEGYPEGAGSRQVSEVADLARPRYHVAGGQGVFYVRPPYMNPDLGVGERPTRFVGLAAVDNTARAKSLHALGLTPAADMTPEQLAQRPDGVTASPYGSAVQGSNKRGAPGDAAPNGDGDFGQDWRWQAKRQRAAAPKAPTEPAVAWGNPDVPKDTAAAVYVSNLPYGASYAEVEALFSQAGKVLDIRRSVGSNGRLAGWAHVQFASAEAVDAAVRLNGETLLGRQLAVDAAREGGGGSKPTGKPVEGCWFCLSSAEVDVSLVASVGEEVYLALDKGPITPHHVLLVPVEHMPSWASLGDGAAAEVDAYLAALRAHAAAQGQELVAFERHLALRSKGGNHAHINTLGVSKDAASNAHEVFARHIGAATASPPQLVPAAPDGKLDRAALQGIVRAGEYFLALLPDGSALVAPIARGERLPMDLGRQCLAELAGAPQRADWRACKAANPQEEEEAAGRFKASFSTFDPMSA